MFKRVSPTPSDGGIILGFGLVELIVWSTQSTPFIPVPLVSAAWILIRSLGVGSFGEASAVGSTIA